MMIRQGKSIRLPVSIHTYSCLGHTGAHSALLILLNPSSGFLVHGNTLKVDLGG